MQIVTGAAQPIASALPGGAQNAQNAQTAAAAVLPPFITPIGGRGGGTAFGQTSYRSGFFAQPVGAVVLVTIAFHSDSPLQGITDVRLSATNEPFDVISLKPLTGTISVGAFWHRIKPGDGQFYDVNFKVPARFEDNTFVSDFTLNWSVGRVAPIGNPFDLASAASYQVPNSPTVAQPDFTPSASGELVVALASFMNDRGFNVVSLGRPSGTNPTFRSQADGSAFVNDPGIDVSTAAADDTVPIGARTYTANGVVGEAWVVVFGILPAAPPEFDAPPEEVEAGFGTDPSTGVLVAEPVNALTGNLTLSAVDLSFPGRGPSLRLERTYNGRNTRAGVFGPGWTSGLDCRVTDSGSTATVTRGDGRRDVHRRQADGSYVAPSGVFDVLTRTASGWRLTTPEQLTIDFTNSGGVARVADRNANALLFTTDSSGRVTAITDSPGRSISFAYASDGTLTVASDVAGRSVSYGYGGGRLTTATDAAGATTRYAYDSGGHLISVTDPLGNVVLTNTYDTKGRVTAQRDAVGGTTTFVYDTAGPTTTITSPRGNTTTVTHDPSGHVISLKDALGGVVAYGYDARGDQTTFRDRNGNLWQFGYDDRGNRTRVIDPVGAVATFTFDARNDLLSRADPFGNTWRYTYNARGDLASVADPEGGVTTIETDALGQVTKIADPDGVAISYAYDAFGSVTTVT